MLVLDCKLNGTTVKSDMGMLKDSFAEKSFCSRSITFSSRVLVFASSLLRFLTRFLSSVISFDCLNIVQFGHIYGFLHLLNLS